MVLNARRLDDHRLVLLAVEDVTDRRAGERELQELNETLEARVEERTGQVRALARALALAERRRIGHLLHDDLQQRLHGLGLTLALLRRFCREDGAAEVHARAEETLAGAAELTQTLSHEMAPPVLRSDDLGDLLRWTAERKRELYGLAVEVEVRGPVAVPDEPARVLVYQLVQELLFDVAKHAGVGRARVVAERTDRHVRIVVEDEGAGFDPAALEGNAGLGLPSVRDRLEMVGGRLAIESSEGGGTRVTVEVPALPE